MKKRSIHFFLALVAAVLLAVTAVRAQIIFPDGSTQTTAAGAPITGVQTFQGSVNNPTAGVTEELINLTGPGRLLWVFVEEQEGANDLTFVNIILDGVTIENRTFTQLQAAGLTVPNPTGTMAVSANVSADTDGLVFGLPYPLEYEQSLVVQVTPGGSNTGVTRILARVMVAD